MTPNEVLQFARKTKPARSISASPTSPACSTTFPTPSPSWTRRRFEEGFGIDGSSIRGWAAINESDMLLIPDPDHGLHGSVRRDPDAGACSATSSTRSPGSATSATRAGSPRRPSCTCRTPASPTPPTSAPKPSSSSSTTSASTRTSTPASTSSTPKKAAGTPAASEDNLGYRPRYKEGYFPVPPTDHYQDLRTEMVQTMIEVRPGHRVPPPRSRHRRPVRDRSALRHAGEVGRQHDAVQVLVRNVANQYGKTVTFMPKPLFGDNGSGMHVPPEPVEGRQAAVRGRRLRRASARWRCGTSAAC